MAVLLLGIAGATALVLFGGWNIERHPRGQPPTPPAGAQTPAIIAAEVWYTTAPAAGVWAEFKLVLDNPLATGATKTTVVVPDSLLEDFRMRSTEPKLLSPPQRRPDGRYALVFPAPISRSLNWYRVFLICRGSAPRPIEAEVVLDGPAPVPIVSPARALVYYSDRQGDPFQAVPEPLVSWVPAQGPGVFPVLVTCALAVGAVTLAGCAAALYMVRR